MNKLLTILLIASFTFFAHAKKIDAPELSITDTKGTTYNVTETEEGLIIQGLEGKVLLLEFFGHKCPPCLASIPHLIDLQKKHKKDVAILSIEVQGLSNKEVLAFAKKKGINYITVAEEKASKFVNYIQGRAQWKGSIPFLVALNPAGDVKYIHAGMLQEESLEDLITELKETKK